MESFEESDEVTSVVVVAGEILAILTDGKFGKIKLNGDGVSSFVPLCESKYKSPYLRQQFLFKN